MSSCSRRNRPASLLLALALGLFAGEAAAEETPAPYRLAPGDRIAVAVLGQPDFSGDFMVEPSGTILLPFVGEVPVGGRTLAECQATIAARYSEGLLKHPAVGVRMQEFRPIYVMGDVRLPGAYPFRYGATVKSALASAGGYAVPGLLLPAATADYVAADERRRDLRLQQLALIAKEARLAAQRAGASSFDAPAAPEEGDRLDLDDLLATERDAFAAIRGALASEVDLLRAQKPRIEREIAAIKTQKAVEEEQADAIHVHSQQYVGLVKQGLGLATQDLQFKLDETTRRSNIMRLSAEISRLEMDSGEIDIKIGEAQAASVRQAETELEDVRQRLKQVGIALRSAEQIAALKGQVVGGFSEAKTRVVTVSRTLAGRVVTIPASESTAVAPGDIVETTWSGSEAPASAGMEKAPRTDPVVGEAHTP